MSRLLAWAAGHWSTALTWLQVFKGPCIALALIALALGTHAGWTTARWKYSGDLEKSRSEFTAYRERVAVQTADAVSAALKIQREEWEKSERARRSILDQIEIGNLRILDALKERNHEIDKLLQDPRWECLREPLPDDVLERLRRTGALVAP